MTPDPQNPLSPAACDVLIRGEGQDGETLNVMLHDPNAGKKGKSAAAVLHYEHAPKAAKVHGISAKALKAMSEADRQAALAKKAQEEAAEAQLQAAAAKRTQDRLAAAGREPRTAVNHWIPVTIDVGGTRAAVWVEGCYVGDVPIAPGAHGAIGVVLPTGFQMRQAQVSPWRESLLLPLDLSAFANDRFPAPLGQSRIEVGGVEFRLPSGPENQINLRPAEWLEWKADGVPWSTEGYDGGSRLAFDPRMPVLRVPCMDYLAAHVLAVADDDPQQTSTLVLRPRGHEARLAMQWDFTAPVPRQSQLASLGGNPQAGTPVVTTPAGRLVHVVVPMEAIAQDLSLPHQNEARSTEMMEIDLTKEVRVAVIAPLACRWRYRPLGLPSGVRIAAITFEKAPLQMRVSSKETGHAFVQPGNPVFQVRLENITGQTQPYTLVARARHLDGTPAESRSHWQCGGGQNGRSLHGSARAQAGLLHFGDGGDRRPKRELRAADQFRPLAARRDPQAPRPVALWDLRLRQHRLWVRTTTRCSAPCTSSWACVMECVFLRRFLQEVRPAPRPGAEYFQRQAWHGPRGLAENDRQRPRLSALRITFHESGVSGDHETRVPDIFVERPYGPSEKEQEGMKKTREKCIVNFQAMRKEFPHVNIALVNGPIPGLEAFLPPFPRRTVRFGRQRSGLI